MYQDRVVRV